MEQRVAASIEQALKDGHPVVAATSYGFDEPLAGPHAYTVSAYDSQSGTVTLRNPWGTNPTSGRQREKWHNNSGRRSAEDASRYIHEKLHFVVLTLGSPKARFSKSDNIFLITLATLSMSSADFQIRFR